MFWICSIIVIYYIVQKTGFYKQSAANPLLFDNKHYLQILCDNNTVLRLASFSYTFLKKGATPKAYRNSVLLLAVRSKFTSQNTFFNNSTNNLQIYTPPHKQGIPLYPMREKIYLRSLCNHYSIKDFHKQKKQNALVNYL